MKKVITLMYFCILLVISACSSNDLNDVQQIQLRYWETSGNKSPDDYLDNKNDIHMFVEAVNNAGKNEKQKIITTKPLLSFEIFMKDNQKKNYHLWLTENGEGFIQRLLPEENVTFKLNENSIETLTDFFGDKEDFNLISSEIEFEK